MDLWQVLLCSSISAGGAGLIALAGMKSDMNWVKQLLFSHNDRITFLERNKNGS